MDFSQWASWLRNCPIGVKENSGKTEKEREVKTEREREDTEIKDLDPSINTGRIVLSEKAAGFHTKFVVGGVKTNLRRK